MGKWPDIDKLEVLGHFELVIKYGIMIHPKVDLETCQETAAICAALLRHSIRNLMVALEEKSEISPLQMNKIELRSSNCFCSLDRSTKGGLKRD